MAFDSAVSRFFAMPLSRYYAAAFFERCYSCFDASPCRRGRAPLLIIIFDVADYYAIAAMPYDADVFRAAIFCYFGAAATYDADYDYFCFAIAAAAMR